MQRIRILIFTCCSLSAICDGGKSHKYTTAWNYKKFRLGCAMHMTFVTPENWWLIRYTDVIGCSLYVSKAETLGITIFPSNCHWEGISNAGSNPTEWYVHEMSWDYRVVLWWIMARTKKYYVAAKLRLMSKHPRRSLILIREQIFAFQVLDKCFCIYKNAPNSKLNNHKKAHY